MIEYEVINTKLPAHGQGTLVNAYEDDKGNVHFEVVYPKSTVLPNVKKPAKYGLASLENGTIISSSEGVRTDKIIKEVIRQSKMPKEQETNDVSDNLNNKLEPKLYECAFGSSVASTKTTGILKSSTQSGSTYFKLSYENICWNCRSFVDSESCKRCPKCGYYICRTCGACKKYCSG